MIIVTSVTNINDVAPSFTSNATVSVAENQTTALTLVATDSDSSSIAYSISGTNASSFSINSSTGVVTFNSPPDFESGKTSYTFTATASDGTLSTTQNVTVNITDISGTPVFSSPNTLSIAESSSTTALTLLAVDEDGDTMTYSITGTDASLFNINSSTGVITFKGAPDFESGKTSYSFTANVNDGNGGTATQNITITITDANDNAPVITNSLPVSVNENQTTAFTVTATDADANTVFVYSLGTGGDESYFNIDSATGVITFKVAPDYETKSSYSIVFRVSDGGNMAITETSISITNANEAPTFTSNPTVSVAENQTTALTVAASDVDGGTTLSYSISGTDASSFSIDSSTGVVSFVSPPNFEAKSSYTFTVTASDGSLSTNQNVTINITDANEAPNLTSATTVTNDEGTTTALSLSATDPDASTTLSYSIGGTDVSYFNVDSTTGVITFKTPSDSETKSSYSITATVSDGTNQDTATITINVADTTSTAQLGVLANATVKIYELGEGGTQTHLYTETTSDGTTFESIGKFDNHFESLDSSKFYLYEVSGGTDKDADDDGVLDTTPTTNNGTIRLVSKGEWLQNATEEVRVTAASEILYQAVASTISSNFSHLETNLDLYTKNIVSQDINNDEKIDTKDIVIFDPVADKTKLNPSYQGSNLTAIINQIHANNDSFKTAIQARLEGNPMVSYYPYTNLRNMKIIDQTAYLAHDNNFSVVNISDPLHFVTLGTSTISTASGISGITSDNYAYVYGSGGLNILNLNNPSSITATQTNLNLGCYLQVIQGDYGYCENTSNGDFQIFEDIMTHGNLGSAIATLTTTSADYITLSSDGNSAYLMDGANLLDVNITTKTAPATTNTIAITGGVGGMKLYGNYLFILHSSPASVEVRDIRNLSNIVSTFPITNWNPHHLTLSSDGTQAVVSGSDGLVSFLNITDPTNISLLKTEYFGSALNITLANDYLYLGDGYENSTLFVYDGNNPNTLASENNETLGYTNDIQYSSDGSKVYYGTDNNNNYFAVFDSSTGALLNSTALFETKSLAIDGSTIYAVGDTMSDPGIAKIDSDYNTIYATAYTYRQYQTIRLSSDKSTLFGLDGNTFDSIATSTITANANLSAPQGSLSYMLGTDFEISENYAFIADKANGVKVVDISNHSSLSLTQTVATTSANSIALYGTKAYVADGSAGLRVLDISTPASSSIVATASLDEKVASQIVVSKNGTRAYLFAGTEVYIFDISTATPAKIAQFFVSKDTDTTKIFLNFDNTKLFVSDQMGQRTFDISIF